MHMISLVRKLTLSVSILGLVPMTSAAMAQETAAPASAGTDIVVTATRRSEGVQKVPASIVALNAESLVRQGVFNTKDLAKAIPNLNIVSVYGEGGSPNFVLRGITSNDYSLNQSRPVAVYIDDGLRGLPALEVASFFDVDRVEVLRGPQGTLYGKNATGGAINIVTKKPTFRNDGYVTLGYGNYNRVDARGAVETVIVPDKLAVRAAFTYTHDDGLIQNLLPGHGNREQTDLFAARVTFAYNASPDVEAYLRLNYVRSGGNGIAPNAIAIRDNVAAAGVTRSDLGFFQVRSNYEDPRDIEAKGLNLTVNTRLSDKLKLVSVTTYDTGKWVDLQDADGTELAIDQDVIAADQIHQFTQELRLMGDYGKLNWMVGGFYDKDSAHVFNDYHFENDPKLDIHYFEEDGSDVYGFNERNTFHQSRESYAAYVRSEYEIVPTVKLTVGGRYSHDRIAADSYNAWIGGATVTGAPVELFQTIADGGVSSSFDRFTGEAGLSWQARPTLLAYATFHQGYRTGAINALAFEDPNEVNAVKPETVNSYEIGFKSRWFGDMLTFNASAFRYDYKNQQYENNVGRLILLANANKSRIWGAEFDLTAKPTQSLQFTVSGGWLDPKYLDIDVNGEQFSGRQLIGASKFSLNLGATWDAIQNGENRLSLHADTGYKSKIWFDAPNTVGQDGYWVTNGRITYSTPKYDLSFWVRNLFEQKYYVSIFKYFDAVGVNEATRGAPRTLGIEGTIHF
ncbi:TonB-dependent receptor [Sphingobium sp. Sx8-8]|uniref:TonB-dependent receptor n=1 Tax=Sphingobium sp. Sx8-8 TaxID=2933617 RepID=UPI001F55ECEA|nr:TonB-dependent receptor [Sphingobium sp. Sx8-8]